MYWLPMPRHNFIISAEDEHTLETIKGATRASFSRIIRRALAKYAEAYFGIKPKPSKTVSPLP